MIVLKGVCPVEGYQEQEFTDAERETAIAISKIWYNRGWEPRLLVKSWDGRFTWLTSLLSQQKAA